MAPIKLTYFNTTGLGESIRYLLAYGGLEFEDIRIGMKDFLNKKQSFPVGQLPILEIDGMTLYQSNSICRYLGTKLGLMGKDAKETVMCDIMADNIYDIRMWLSMIYHEPHAEAKEMKRETVLAQVELYLKKLEEQAKNNNGYLVGGQLTWVDFVLVGVHKYFSVMAGKDVFENRESLSNLRDKIVNLPAIQRYIQTKTSSKL